MWYTTLGRSPFFRGVGKKPELYSSAMNVCHQTFLRLGVIPICPVNRILYLLKIPVSAIACLWSYLTPILIDPDSWEWHDKSSSRWEVAVEVWQAFNTIWYGASAAQCASLHDSRSPFLALGPLATRVGLTSSMLVRECFVTMFEHVCATTRLLPEGLRGVIITGQPGVGVYSFQPSLS